MNEQQQAQGPQRISLNWQVTTVIVLFGAGLVFSGAMRFFNLHSENPPQWTGYATIVYIAITVFAAIRLTRIGVPMNRLGFGVAVEPMRVILLAGVGIGLIQLFSFLLDPLLVQVFGEARNLERFSDVAGRPAVLVQLLALNWTVAAFGEELAFRIVLMRGIAFALGDSRAALIIALIGQAIVFGAIHAYQGPAGIVESGINGLVFGGLTLAARGSIWPAALAHGSSNTIGIVTLYLSG